MYVYVYHIIHGLGSPTVATPWSKMTPEATCKTVKGLTKNKLVWTAVTVIVMRRRGKEGQPRVGLYLLQCGQKTDNNRRRPEPQPQLLFLILFPFFPFSPSWKGHHWFIIFTHSHHLIFISPPIASHHLCPFVRPPCRSSSTCYAVMYCLYTHCWLTQCIVSPFLIEMIIELVIFFIKFNIY